MEFLAQPYLCLLEVRHRMECGHSTSEALRNYFSKVNDPFAVKLLQWQWSYLQGRQGDEKKIFNSPLQILLVETIKRGLSGEPILTRLAEVEEEMRLEMIDAMEKHLQKLPVLSLLPLTGFIFPSFMLLLIGPLMSDLFNSFKS
ncbi:MAG: hypothetical protein K1X29_08575 [Bdellovibrionales bacterium]|nr:hypothetical protein [Bdellovibrionales bacterium]